MRKILTKEQVKGIKADYKSGLTDRNELAKKYNSTYANVCYHLSKIRTRRTTTTAENVGRVVNLGSSTNALNEVATAMNTLRKYGLIQ